MKKARINSTELKELTTLEGRIKYLESLRDVLDKNDDSVDSNILG